MRRPADPEQIKIDMSAALEGLSPDEATVLTGCLLFIEAQGKPVPVNDVEAARALGMNAKRYFAAKIALIGKGRLKRTPDGIVLGDGVGKLIMRGRV